MRSCTVCLGTKDHVDAGFVWKNEHHVCLECARYLAQKHCMENHIIVSAKEAVQYCIDNEILHKKFHKPFGYIDQPSFNGRVYENNVKLAIKENLNVI